MAAGFAARSRRCARGRPRRGARQPTRWRDRSSFGTTRPTPCSNPSPITACQDRRPCRTRSLPRQPPPSSPASTAASCRRTRRPSRDGRGAPAGRRRVRGHPGLRRAGVRARRPSRPARAFGSEPSARRVPRASWKRDSRAALGAGRGRVRRLPPRRADARRPRLLLTEPLPATPERVRLGVVEYAPARPGRDQVALLRRQHALRPARARARVRRGAARDPARARAGGADLVDLLGGRRRRHQHAAAQPAHPRVDHAPARDGGRGRPRAALHDGRPASGERGVPGVHDARGAVDRRDRDFELPHGERTRESPRTCGGGSTRSWQPADRHGHRQPPAVREGGCGLPKGCASSSTR